MSPLAEKRDFLSKAEREAKGVPEMSRTLKMEHRHDV